MRAPVLTQKRARVLRRNMTEPERTLWAMLRKTQQNMRFRRQHPVGPYILDFYCPAEKLAVEIDGPSHEDRVEHDARRDAWLAKQGIRVMRFTVAELEARPAAVIAKIARGAAPSTA